MKERQAARERSFNALLAMHEQREVLEQKLAELDGPYGEVYAAAEADSWTVEELTEYGFKEPVKRPKQRRSGRRSAPKKDTPATPKDAPAESPAADVPVQGGPAESAPAVTG